MRRPFAIAGREIGGGAPCFVIAEAGVNHDGDVRRALELVDVAVAAGADAVKFQTFAADRLATRDAPKAAYQQTASGAAESQHVMLARLELSAEAHRSVFEHCARRGIAFLSTPFDERSADFLGELGVAAFKTPSGELTNLPFLAHVARFGKPLIVSTGMSTLADVEAGVAAVEAAGAHHLALLHCVSNYPAAPATANLRAMETLTRAFGFPVGYSDHTLGTAVALAAVALGASIVEKHVTVDRARAGPDHGASLEPDEFRALVAGIREVESALGDGRKRPAPGEVEMAAVARKSIVAASDIARGSTITREMLTALRPGTGISPASFALVLGRTTCADVAAGTVLAWEMLA